MAAEENLNKVLYKVELYLIKIIPMLLAGISLLNTILAYCFGIDSPILSYIGGVSFLTLAFLYLSSYVFRFCAWHRMFLHYIVIVNVLNIYDYYVGIPVSDYHLFVIHIIITGVCLFLVAYLKFRK